MRYVCLRLVFILLCLACSQATSGQDASTPAQTPQSPKQEDKKQPEGLEKYDPDEETIKHIKELKAEMARKQQLKTMSREMDASIEKALSSFDKAKNSNQMAADTLLEELENNLRQSQRQLRQASEELDRQSAQMNTKGQDK